MEHLNKINMFTHLTKTCPYYRDKVYRTYQGLKGVLMAVIQDLQKHGST